MRPNWILKVRSMNPLPGNYKQNKLIISNDSKLSNWIQHIIQRFEEKLVTKANLRE